MLTRYYMVAECAFSVTAEEGVFDLMANYEPFSKEVTDEVTFELTMGGNGVVEYEEEGRQSEEGQEIVCGHTEGGEAVFEYRWWNETAGWLVCDENYQRGKLVMTGRYPKMAVDNALMVLFSLATAERGRVLFHAAVVRHGGRGYMFLGKSGTGKSTHARMWLKYIQGTDLVNDDNPVVRVANDGTAVVYGSPWSGKTPCYRNVSCPLGGIVQLSQAPYNRIERLRGVKAYAVLVPSISGKRWNRRIADGLYQTENSLAMHVPVWHLECLPDEDAAKVCKEATSNE